LAGLLIYSVLPLDLTIHPRELGQKFLDGKVALVPFADFALTPDYLYGLVRDFVVFLPVGMWVATWRTGSASSVRSVPVTMFWGAMIAAGIEAAQLFVYSRYTSTQDVLLGTLAAGAGGAIMWRWRSVASPNAPEPAARRLRWAMGSLLAAAVYGGGLLLAFCVPFEMLRDPVVLRQRFEGFLAVPFAGLYWGSEFNAVSEVVYKLLWFAPLGVLLTLTVEWLQAPRRVHAVLLLAALLAAVALALGVELVQIFFPPRVPDITDVLLYSTGSATGMFVTNRACASRRCPPVHSA
jgi:VanZ family protein